MKRCGQRCKRGSVKRQAIDQVVVKPIKELVVQPFCAAIRTFSKSTGSHEGANAARPSKESSSIYHPPDVGDSEVGSSTTPVRSSKSHLSLEENLPTAPVPPINPRFIATIHEDLLLKK